MRTINNIINSVAEKKAIHIWIVLGLLIFLSAFMLYAYGFNLSGGHDYYFHNARFEALMKALQNGMFPVYIDYDGVNGYGYLPKLFYSDVILIPFAIIGNLTSTQTGYLSILFTMTVLCGLFTYIVVNKIYKNSFAAAVSALLYTFCMYRLYDLYHRAALGEVLSFTFLPIVFLGLYYIIKGDYKKWYVITIGFCLTIFSHLISSVVLFITVIIILAIYYKDLKKEPKRLLYLAIAGGASLLILAYYIYPMAEQLLSNTFYLNTDTWSYPDKNKINPYHIIWGMTNGLPLPDQGFSPRLGLLLTLGIIVRIFIRNNGKSPLLRSADILVILGLLFVFATSSLFPWSVFPFSKMNYLQFPWRLYEFSSLFFAVAGGYYLSILLKSNVRKFVVLCFITLFTVLALLGDGKYYNNFTVQYRDTYEYINMDNHYYISGLEYYPAKVPSTHYIQKRGIVIDTKDSTTNITNFARNKNITTFDVEIKNPDQLELPLLYYKGYKATLNGENLTVEQSDNGLLALAVNQSGRVEVYYKGTAVQYICFWISIAAIVALCIYIFLSKKRKK